MENDYRLTIEALAPLIRRKKLSPVELTRALLDRIERLQPAINAYITIAADAAMAQARKAEKEIVKGHYRGVLHGIPISLKRSLFHPRNPTHCRIQDPRSVCASRECSPCAAPAGMRCVVLGKTNLHEFAFGATNVNPHYGPVRNHGTPAACPEAPAEAAPHPSSPPRQ
jgi:aspartyl-tRNA(Asn)/glutamyl-tRNA(Gln) amidotransferase subunit A